MPVSHNLADRNKSEALLVAACSSNDVTGFGEGTPRSYVTGEDIDTCLKRASEICRMLKGISAESMPEIESALEEAWQSSDGSAHPSAFCAVELAVLDLHARLLEKPMWHLFSKEPNRTEFIYSAVIPMIEGPRFFLLLDYIKSQRIQFAKIKVSDVNRGIKYITKVRELLGEDIDLRVDANGAFSWEKAIEFLKMADTKRIGISAFEQPTPADDLAAMRKVTELGDVPVFADESFRNEADMRMLMEHKACAGFNIRLSKCGGFRKSLKLYHFARQHGFACQIGCHVGETAVLASAGRHLAALCNQIEFLEGSYSKHVLKEDISEQDVTFGKEGRANLLPGPGIGVTINCKAIERWGKVVKEI